MTQNQLACELYISDNKLLFEFLKKKRETIEHQLGAKLEWIEATKACRAVQRRENADIDDDAAVHGLFDWMIDRAIAFDRVFGPLVKEFRDGTP